VPWNADAILVEAILRLPPAARRKTDFTLQLPDREPIAAENLKTEPDSDRYRIFFRWCCPGSRPVIANLCWKKHRLGQVAIPVLGNQEFLGSLRLDAPTVFARISSQNVACRTFVGVQCRGLLATAILASGSGSLAPLVDLGVTVQFRDESELVSVDVAVPLSSSQLGGKQALISAHLPKLPRRTGEWNVTWLVGNRVMGMHHLRVISRRQFIQSLRVSDARFVVVDHKGQMSLRRQIPNDGSVRRAGPCFFVSSREMGMAGRCHLQVHAQVPGGIQSAPTLEQDVLITDGPTPFAPGLMDAGELAQSSAFELRSKSHVLGILPLSPVPAARFTSEGGYVAPPEFPWTNSADEELTERLQRLLEGKTG
jgi:hypothetical protein